MKELRIESLEAFITAVRALSVDFNNRFLWWRGQADANWTLTPGIIRSKALPFEGDLISRFYMKARSRYPNCPQNDDIAPWLFLMQHYGLPTRLLDWTESPLVALYFAVQDKDHDDKDAAIWGLQPFKLNLSQTKKAHLFLHGSSEVKTLFHQTKNSYQGERDLRTLAVQTVETDIRHLVQQSEFTIHGSSTAMEDLEDNELFLGKIIISASAKGDMRGMLDTFGITRSYLFPDLENLSAELASLDFEE